MLPTPMPRWPRVRPVGCSPLVPARSTSMGAVVAAGDVAGQAEQVMANLRVALAAAGAQLTDVVKTTVYVATASGGSAHGLGGCPPPLRRPRGSKHPARRGRARLSGPARGGRGRRCAPMRPRPPHPSVGSFGGRLRVELLSQKHAEGCPRTTSAGASLTAGSATRCGVVPALRPWSAKRRIVDAAHAGAPAWAATSVRPSVACSLMLIWLQGGPSSPARVRSPAKCSRRA